MRTLLLPPPLAPGRVTLDADEAHHGRTVLRLRAGDAVRVADGGGHEGEATVVACERSLLEVEITAVRTLPEDPARLLTVACAVPKGDRFADLVRGLTELGIGAIRPLRCARGERIPDLARVRRVAAEALKQCRRARLPELGPVAEIATIAAPPTRAIVLDRMGLPFEPHAPVPTTLIVGPEGGFAPEELDRLRAAGVAAVRLAGPVLRIETAALAAAAVWTAAWESWR